MGGISGLFVPTSEGIIVIDGPGTPCEPDSGQWFKDELERRYDVPVRYVVLSHDHQSHICGTTVFADTAVSIGHKKIRAHLIREGRVAPVPTVTFEESLDIDLGGVKVVLHYFGPTHSDNLIVIHIPQDGVLFAPDLSRPAGQLPNPDFRDMDVDSTIEVLGILARMDDVDIVVPGHNSPVSNQAYFRRYREYLASLRERVLTQMVAGRSLEEILGLVTMDDFGEYTNLEQVHVPNITSMYDYLYRYREPNSPGSMPIRVPQ
jgi:glyoxylase-like metal-dependent hydrolase (beta-lactamase superfamily II)